MNFWWENKVISVESHWWLENKQIIYWYDDWSFRILWYNKKHNLNEVEIIHKPINWVLHEIQWRVNNVIVWEMEFDLFWNWTSEIIYLDTVNQHKKDLFHTSSNILIPWLWSLLIDEYIKIIKEKETREFNLYSSDHAFWFYQKKFERLKDESVIKSFIQFDNDFFVSLN